MTDIFRALAAPFPPDRVSWRVGSTTSDKSRGMALAYIDARDVMDRLDEVVGPGNWQCRYPHANGKTVCEIGINVAAGMAQVVDGHASPVERWVWKADGAGDTDVEAEKGALSDAFKRAAVRWGIGRYLYDLDSPWVSLKQVGRSYAIADNELPRLRRLLGGHVLDAEDDAARATDEKIAITMVEALALAETVGDLTDWANDPNTKRSIADLPRDLADRVRGAWRDRREALSGGRAAA